MLQLIDEALGEKIEEISPNTIRIYRWSLERFADWLRANGLRHDEVSRRQLLEWLNTYGWSQSTKHNAACALRLFYRHLVGAENSPAEGVRIRRPQPRAQRTLTEDEVQRLLASLDTSTETGARNLSIITLMIDTGLRANELCSLHVEHVNPLERTLDVRIKGGDWHRSVFGEYAASCLDTWLGVRRWVAGLGVPFLYVGIGGKTAGQKMTVTGLRATFYKLARKAGIPLFSPHALRRTYATLATRYGEPKRTVQVNGGWKTPDMVDRYTMHIRPEDFRHFPSDHLMGLG